MNAQEFIVRLDSYGVIDGLPHREVNAVHQCSRGFVWVGTPQGLSRFDGRQFTTFNSRTDHFQHDNIWRILEDADGWFWLLPIPPYEDFDIWHPVTRERTSFLKKFGKSQALPSVNPTGWVTSANDTTLQRQIKHTAGLTTNHNIQEARLQQARELLVNNKALVNKAAVQVGFKDVKHFAGLYKCRFGKLPSEA